jgi:hypothetical protein
MSIYITQQQKEEWEAKYKHYLELRDEVEALGHTHRRSTINGMLSVYHDLLATSTVLPIEESWEEFDAALLSYIRDEEYPNGVIIKKK